MEKPRKEWFKYVFQKKIRVLFSFFKVCSGMLDEAGKSLDEMEGEARTAPLQFRAEMLANVRKYRSSVSSLQTQLNKARIVREVSDRSLERGAHGGGGGGVVVQDQHRQQVLAGTQILDRTGESLFRAQQVALETDAVGRLRLS